MTLSVLCTPESLRELPDAIWCPGGPSFPSVYRGTPSEMVQQMAEEMGPGVETTEAVRILLEALANHRRIHIRLPEHVPNDVLAGLFVFALLDLGISRPMPSA